MKKIIAIACIVFAAIIVLALPASAATPYQTYTYSINGTALYSPDAYEPARQIDAQYMGLTDVDFLCKYHSSVANTRAKLQAAEAAYEAIKNDPTKSNDDKKAAENLVKSAQTDYNTEYTKYSKLNTPTDLETDINGNVYVADSANNRIIVMDRNYKAKFIISEFANRQGIIDVFNNPQGVYITADNELTGRKGKIYVCDTSAYRIVTFDLEGNFLDVIAKPESELFGAEAGYEPVAVAVDNYDRLYVVSKPTYQGIIVMTANGEFTGFVGAQQVSISAMQKLFRRFMTDEMRKEAEANISKAYNNITLTGDFIYATIDLSGEYPDEVLEAITNKEGTYSPVKMLNASGEEIMRRNGFFGPCGEVDHQKLKLSDPIGGASVIVDVAVGPAKTWSIIDQKRSKVFTYDFDGNLLFAFGDRGRQLGNIPENGLAGITYHEGNMLLLTVSEQSTGFVVYERTPYGDILIDALDNQIKRQNDKAISDWKKILKRNSNFDAAYIGIGNALSNEKNYEEALDYYMSAYETMNYSLAYKELRKEWISKWIILIPIGVGALAFAITKFLGYSAKFNKKVSTTKGKRTYWQELMFAFHTIFHPFDAFWDMKHEKRGSVRAGTTILAVTIFAFYYQGIGQGYIMNPTGEYTTIISSVLGVVVPLALWVIANWCLTTLFDGEGSIKDVYIATTYALTPLPLLLIPTTIASNFVLDNEVAIITLISAIGFIWAGMLIFLGSMVTHDYTMGKNVLTSCGTIVGMVIIMFIALLFSTLLTKMVGFVSNVVTEIRFRM